MIYGAVLLGAGFLFLAQQSSPELSVKRTVQKNASKAPQDDWDKMKACATQAEKQSPIVTTLEGLNKAGTEIKKNHYSPKYNRCFVEFRFSFLGKDITKGGPLERTFLIDPFEQAIVATSAASFGIPIEFSCRDAQNPKGCESEAVLVWKGACGIGDKAAGCDEAQKFIDDHMKN
jgi:hypothetical protein